MLRGRVYLRLARSFVGRVVPTHDDPLTVGRSCWRPEEGCVKRRKRGGGRRENRHKAYAFYVDK